MFRCPIPFPARAAATFVVGLCLAGRTASAVEVFKDGDTAVHWDNVVKYSGAFRLSPADRALIIDPNGDEGDRNFHAGLISNRFDLLSELNISVGAFGATVSGAAWYDIVYNSTPHADTSPPPSFYPLPARFRAETRDLHGRDAELLNAFIYGGGELAGLPVAVRAGRHTLLWGESLFFAGNGIAAGQAPIDAIKALSVPLSRAKEVYMPVAQISASLQPATNWSLSAYYQFEWRRSRLPGVGSYFSAADFLDAGGRKLYVAPDRYVGRTPDQTPSSHGQFGAAVRYNDGDIDVGFYGLRYHAKDPQIYVTGYPVGGSTSSRLERPMSYGTSPGVFTGPSNPLQISLPSAANSPPGQVGDYTLVYPRGIEIYGASFSTYLGDSNVAGELSLRRRMPLASTALIVTPNVAADADNNPLYARGNTLHGQISSITNVPPSTLWDTAAISAEMAFNHVLNVTRNTAALDPSRDRTAAAFRVQVEPSYFSVLPGLDVSVPLSIGLGMFGRSATDTSQNPGAGSLEVGLGFTYRTAWSGSLTLTRFLGGPARQPYADRHLVSFSVQRAF